MRAVTASVSWQPTPFAEKYFRSGTMDGCHYLKEDMFYPVLSKTKLLLHVGIAAKAAPEPTAHRRHFHLPPYMHARKTASSR